MPGYIFIRRGLEGGLLALVMFFGMASDAVAESQAGTTPAQIEIGFIAPLSGPFAGWGESLRRGMALAQEDVRRKFKIDYQDDSCDPGRAVSIAQKFLSLDGIRLIIGPGCPDGLKAILPLAERKNALIFSTTLLDDQVFEKHPNLINFATQISTEVEYLAGNISRSSVRRVAILHGTNDFGEEFGRQLPVYLKRSGLSVTSSEATSLAATDFKTEILRLMKSAPDAIFIHQGESQIVTFMKQLRAQGILIPVYSYFGAESESVLKDGGSAVDGLLYSYPLNASDDSSQKLAFDRKFKERFGARSFPSATSYYVYDGLMLLDQALNICSPSDTVCVRKYFRQIGTDQPPYLVPV